MKVLHVALGLPPLRTGGLTRYCIETMEAQVAAGDNVSLLYPSRFLPGRTRVGGRKEWRAGIGSYEVINPLPVPLTYGVAEPEKFMAPCDAPGAYGRFLSSLRPDVIHVHSFQGIHQEFFRIARQMGIPMVFTTHDYYPMCPRCTFITSRGEDCTDGPSGEACALCNEGVGMTWRKSAVMQSGTYARLKSSRLVRAVGTTVKRRMSSSGGAAPAETAGAAGPSATTAPPAAQSAPAAAQAYARLLDYDREILSLFTLILANSTMTMAEYRRRFPDARCALLPITHAGLRREGKNHHRTSGDPLRIGYFGGCKTYKGYGTLLVAARILDGKGISFALHLYGDDYGDVPQYAHAVAHGRIAPSAVHDELAAMDLVIVPSIYRETFGFVVLESLCAGTPVICSDAVGAKDLVKEGRVFRAGDAADLADRVAMLTSNGDLTASLPADYPLSMDEHVRELSEKYREARRICRPSDAAKRTSDVRGAK